SLAAGMYGASGASRTQWWRLQPAIDTLDFLVIVAEWRRGAVSGPAAGLMAGTALLATALGSVSAAAEAEEPPLTLGRLAGDTLKLIGLVLPLGLDTFGVAMALGIAGLPARGRIHLALLFAGFETAMPLVGVALGAPLGRALGSAAEYIASALLIVLGVYMLLANEDGDEG